MRAATAAPSAMSSSAWSAPIASCPRARASASTRWPSMPPAPLTSTLTARPPLRVARPLRSRAHSSASGVRETAPLFAHVSQDPDLGVVADHEVVRARLAALVAVDLHVAPQQRGLHAPAEVAHRGAGQQDRVLDLGALDQAVL